MCCLESAPFPAITGPDLKGSSDGGYPGARPPAQRTIPWPAAEPVVDCDNRT